MKKIILMMFFILVLPITLGETTEKIKYVDGQEITIIDGHKFTLIDGVWIHDDLGLEYVLEKEYASAYKENVWETWYEEGNPTLKKILELGDRIHFRFNGTDGIEHNFSVFPDKEALIVYFRENGKLLAALIGGGVVVGAIIIDNNGDDTEASPTKR